MKKTNLSANGTSFHDITITTTINKLTDVLGLPTYFDNSGQDKVNVEWVCETEEGNIVTIYDWKEYRSLRLDDEVEFHIGGKNVFETLDAKDELKDLLKKVA